MITVFRCLDLGLKGYMLYDDSVNNENPINPNTASKVLSAAGFILQSLGYVAETGGVSHENLHAINVSEYVVRVIDLPVKALDALRAQRRNRDIDFKSVMNQCFIVPYLTFLRSANEMEINSRKAYLALPPEKRAAQTTPIYEQEGLFFKYKGEQPIDSSKMEQELELLEKTLPVIHFCQIAASYKNTKDREKQIFMNAMREQNRQIQNLRVLNHAQQLLVNIQQNQGGQNQNIDPFDLVNLQEIPEFLEDDDLFAKYICPITTRPIRFVVGDPTSRTAQGMTLFERTAIIAALENNPISPITRLALDEDDLVDQPCVQANIDTRLRYFSAELRTHARTLFNTPVDPQIQQAAQRENSRY